MSFRIKNHFEVKSLKGFGVQEVKNGIIAAGAVLYYLSETQHNQLKHIQSISRIAEDNYVWMDRFTVRNLELYHSTAMNAITLLNIIDKTISPMGGRLLKRWLALPLKDADRIKQRHEVVQYLLDNESILQKIQGQIKHIGDIERLISKIATAKANPREVIQLKNSLEAIVPVKSIAASCENEALKILGNNLHNCDLLREKIKQTLNEEAPVNVLKGNTIAKGFSEELDELRGLSKSGKD